MSIYPHILSSHSVTFILSRSTLFPVNTYIIDILIIVSTLPSWGVQTHKLPLNAIFSPRSTRHTQEFMLQQVLGIAGQESLAVFSSESVCPKKPCSARRLPRWIQSGGVKRVLYHNQRFLSPQRGPNAPKRCRIQDFEAAWCHCRLSDANAKGEQQVSPIPSFLTWTVLLNVYHWFWFLIVHVHTRCSGWIIGKCQWRYTALPRHVENVSRHGAFLEHHICIYIILIYV